MTSLVPHIKYSPFLSNNEEAGRKKRRRRRRRLRRRKELKKEREKREKKKQIMTLTMLTMKMKDEAPGVIKPAPMMSRKDQEDKMKQGKDNNGITDRNQRESQ